MKYRRLGFSDIEVSEICLGSWVFGGDSWGDVDDRVSENVVSSALDAGINFIDTAPIYGYGRAEIVIGRAIKGKRNNVVLASKCGLKKKGRGIEIDLSDEFIRQDMENSLKRLGVETIDLYQCHWPDSKTPFEETFGAMNKLVREGKVRHIGISNFDKRQTAAALGRSDILTNQVQYSLLDRRIEKDLFESVKQRKISVLPYGILGGGILTGKYRKPPQIKEGDVKDFFYRYYKEPEWSRTMELVSVMDEISVKYGACCSHVAIKWVLSHREVASCIVGCRTPDQLSENIRAIDWEMSEDDLRKLDQISDDIISQ